MFTIKLGTNKTFKATAVSENYQKGFEGRAATRTVRLECTPAEKTLEEYQALLEEQGALDNISVTLEGGTEEVMTFAGYNVLDNMQIRLLSTGEKSFGCTLSLPTVGEVAE